MKPPVYMHNFVIRLLVYTQNSVFENLWLFYRILLWSLWFICRIMV